MSNQDLINLQQLLKESIYQIFITINHKSYTVSWVNPNTEVLVFYGDKNKIQFTGITNDTVLTAIALN